MLFYCQFLHSSGHQVVAAGSYADSVDKHDIRLITGEILHKGTRQGARAASISARSSSSQGLRLSQCFAEWHAFRAKQLRKAGVVMSGAVAGVMWRVRAGGTNSWSPGEPSKEAVFPSTGRESHLHG